MEDKTFAEIYSRGILSIGYKQLSYFKNAGGSLSYFKPKSRREILVTVYYELLKKREIMPLESLSDDQKKQIWEECKPHTEELKKNDKIKFAKAVYALNHIAKKETSESPKAIKDSADNIQ